MLVRLLNKHELRLSNRFSKLTLEQMVSYDKIVLILLMLKIDKKSHFKKVLRIFHLNHQNPLEGENITIEMDDVQ